MSTPATQDMALAVARVRARILGLILLLLSGAMIAWNVWTLEHEERFTPYVLVIAFMGIFLAPLVVIVGVPIDPRTGKRPMWFTVAGGGLGVFGAAMGVLLTVLLWNGMTLLP